MTTQNPTCFSEHLHGQPIDGTPPPQPCPFCRTVEMIAIEDCSSADQGSFHVNCDHCGAEGPIMGTPLAAALAWNAGSVPLGR